jgi:hypothetical protein
LGGAQVLLVEPYLALPPSLDGAHISAQGGLAGQHCLVKLGDRRPIHEEATCYEKHVRDVLSVNVSRMSSMTVWNKRACIRMTLAGDQDWDRATQERDWLVGAPSMDSHHLLDDMFVRDLGRCWHNNGWVVDTQKCLHEVYGRQLPLLLTLSELGPAEGLTCDPRQADNAEEISACSRRGVFLTTLAAMLLREGAAV